MLRKKFKFLILLVTIIILTSSLSFATVEPRASEGDYKNEVTAVDNEITNTLGEGNENEIMPISEGEQTSAEEEEEEEWINGDLYIMQDKYDLDKVVDGNVFILADEVTISSEIGGDVFVCANKLTINGSYIYNSLFAVANEIVIDGIVCDVYGVADSFTLNENGYIYRDLRLSANTFNLKGKIRRDAYVSASNYNISEENGSLIGGNFNYSSKSEITIPEGIVLGKVNFNEEIITQESVVEKVFDYIFDGINALVYTLAVILLSIWLAPKFVQRVSNMNTKKAFVSLGIGIVAPIVTIIALFMLLVSSVASMLSVACILIFIAICISGTAFASIYLGSIFARLLKWEGKLKFVLASLISALIIWVISQIPYIGSIFGFLVALFGIGTLVVNVVYRKVTLSEETAVVKEKTEE